MWLYNNLGIGVHVFVCERTSERKCVCLCWLAHTEYAIIINRRKRHHRNNHRKHIQQPEAWPQRSAHSTTHRIHEKLLCTVCRVRTDQLCVCTYIFWMNRKHVSDEPLIYSIYLFRTFPAIGALLRFYCFYFRDVLSAVLCLYGKVTMKSHMYQSSPLHSIKMIHGVELMRRLALTHDFSSCTSSYIVWRNTTLEFRSYKSQNYWNSKRDIH